MLTFRYHMADGTYLDEDPKDLPRDLKDTEAAAHLAGALLDAKTGKLVPLATVKGKLGTTHILNTAMLVRVSVVDLDTD